MTGEAREHEEVLFTKDGEKLSALCTTAPLRNGDGEVEAVIEMSIDITQIRDCSRSSPRSVCWWARSRTASRASSPASTAASTWSTRASPRKSRNGSKGLGDGATQRGADPLHGARHPLLRQGPGAHRRGRRSGTPSWPSSGKVSRRRRATPTPRSGSSLAEDIGIFAGDPQAIRAMLLNLLENSLDACRMDKDKGDHWIRLDVRREAPWILIEVEDNGMGMDQETREKIFSLFFLLQGHQGHRARALHLQQDRRQARRDHRGRLRAGARHPLHGAAAARRQTEHSA